VRLEVREGVRAADKDCCAGREIIYQHSRWLVSTFHNPTRGVRSTMLWVTASAIACKAVIL
jgi:hypothetical protein